MKPLIAATIAAAALLAAGSASATVVLTTGQFGGTGVHSTAGLSAATVTGTAGSDLVTLSTIGDLLDTNGGGESMFAADDGLFDDLHIAFTDFYDAVTFNLNTPNQGVTAFNLSVNGGAFTFAQGGLSNGENKFELTAGNGDAIHTLDFTFSGADVNDIRQIRVGDVVTPVPEPATWAVMLMGFAGLGAALRRRRRRVLA